MTKKILVCDPMDETALQLLKSQPNLDVNYQPDISAQALQAEIGAYQVVFVRSRTKLRQGTLARASALEVIGRAGTGLDNIDVAFAQSKGIQVLNTPGANANAVAELALCLMLMLARRVLPGVDSVRQGDPTKVKGVELDGKTLGLVGFGNIGRLVARLARGFGMTVVAHDPLISMDQVPEPLRAVPLCGLKELLAQSDFVSLHVPSLESTRGMVNDALLAHCKAGAYLVNTARAELIDAQAVLDALTGGRLAGYATDLPESAGALLGHPNVVVTPHIGASTTESQRRAGVGIVKRVLEALQQHP